MNVEMGDILMWMIQNVKMNTKNDGLIIVVVV